MKGLLGNLGCLVMLMFSVEPVMADAIAVDGTWHEFELGVGCSPNCIQLADPVPDVTGTAPWTFSGSALLTITDVDLSGDRYEILDNNVAIGLTSDPLNGMNKTFCGNDVLVCLANPGMSHGSFLLGAGNHSITIDYTQLCNCVSDGNFGVFEVSAVPEDSAWLISLGLLAAVITPCLRRSSDKT